MLMNCTEMSFQRQSIIMIFFSVSQRLVSVISYFIFLIVGSLLFIFMKLLQTFKLKIWDFSLDNSLFEVINFN